VVLSVDSHQDAHVAAVIINLGAPVADRAFPATAAGYRHRLGTPVRAAAAFRGGGQGHGVVRTELVLDQPAGESMSAMLAASGRFSARPPKPFPRLNRRR
jgi:hypothetical protein